MLPNTLPAIRLNDLIEHVKAELSQPPKTQAMFQVKQLQIEVQVSIERDGKGGIDLHIVNVGVGQTLGNVQKVTITLEPINDMMRTGEFGNP